LIKPEMVSLPRDKIGAPDRGRQGVQGMALPAFDR
jgi:hypothetical protein